MLIQIKHSCKAAPAYLRGVQLTATPDGKMFCRIAYTGGVLILHTDSIVLINPEKQLAAALTRKPDEWDFIREYCYRNGIQYVPVYVGGCV